MTMTWLARHPPETSWAHLTTTDFPACASRAGALAVLPVHGLADHGLGLSLDAEEALASAVLTGACAAAALLCAPCVLPPLRFGPAPHPASTWFGVSLDLADDILLELARSVRFAGFERLLLLSTSPWHKEWLDNAAVDIRIATGLTVYRIHLGALGLDFHPAALIETRLAVQAAAALVLGETPVASAPQESRDEHFRPGHWVHAPPLPAGPFEASLRTAADTLIKQSTARLSRLLIEAAWDGATPDADNTAASSVTAFEQAQGTAPLWRPYGKRLLTALTPAALVAAASQPGAVAILPTAAIEQHGPHLPLGVDALIGQGLLSRALGLLPAECPVYVAPPILVGKSAEHADFPGTLTLTTRTFSALVRAQIEQLYRLGFRRIAVWNTHGGNSAVLVPLLRELQTLPGLRLGMVAHGFKPAQTPLETELGFHAGEWETSLMLELASALVRRAKALRHYPARFEAKTVGELRPVGAALTFGWRTRDLAPDGVLGDATLATPEKGEAWSSAAARALADRLLALSQP